MAPIGLKCIFKTLFLLSFFLSLDPVHTFIYFFLRVPLYKSDFMLFGIQPPMQLSTSGMAATRGHSKNKGHTCVLL